MSRVPLFLNRLREPDEGEDALLRLRTQWLEELQPVEIVEMLTGLAELASSSAKAASDTDAAVTAEKSAQEMVWQKLLPVLLDGIVRAVQKQRAGLLRPPLGDEVVDAIAHCYVALADQRRERSALLEMLTLLASSQSLRQFAEFVVEQPPNDGMGLDRAFARLFNSQFRDQDALFPRLFDGLSQPGVATATLDLANFLTRESRCVEHPASGRADELIELLGGLVARLGALEQPKTEGSLDPEQIRIQIADGVALGVSLCDALGLIGDEKAIPKLNQASELAHRRLRVEAYAALARLGDALGRQELLKLASEPATRLRVVQYARELDLEAQIDAKWLAPDAIAEADLAAWLSEPRQFGIAPQDIELFDHRSLSWPGFNDPVECFLFRFEYQFGEATYANMGIVGPLTHAFLPDLSDLPPLDIYSAFAGWQTTHHDIGELAIDSLDPMRRVDFENLQDKLESLGFTQHEWQFMGVFFGEHVFVGQATKEGVAGALALSAFDYAWFPARSHGRSIDGDLAFSIWKGRRFLKQFNPDELFADASPGTDE